MNTLWRHPKIWTGRSFVTGLLVDGDRIVGSGDADQLAATHRVAAIQDLPGALVVPGLHDAHIHTGGVARLRTSVDIRGAADEAAAVRLVGEFLAANPGTGLVTGGVWNPAAYAPTRASLDAVSGGRPVAIASADYHSLWVNTAALELAGYDRDTTDPAGGRLERDADGELTGILRETACTPIDSMDPDDADRLPELLRDSLNDLLGLGLTAITDIDHEDVHRAFRTLHDRGDLGIRVSKAIRHEDLPLALEQGRRTGSGEPMLRVGPLKLFADGALGSHTCHMTDAFADEDHHGVATAIPARTASSV